MLAAAAVIFAGLAARAAATTLIDCDTPDDFCTGDPCFTSDSLEITVPSCVLDFGARALWIQRPLRVPNGGTLALTAVKVVAIGAILGQHTTASEPLGANISLTATGGPFDIGYISVTRVDASGKTTAGNITFNAVDDIAGGLVISRARGAGATATGGTVTLNAGTNVSTVKKIDVRGRRGSAAGGTVAITAGTSITLVEAAKVDARGFPGGSITLNAGGDVAATNDLRAQGWPDGGGGTISVTAGIEILLADANVSGGAPGAGSITLQANSTLAAERLIARGVAGGQGGAIGITAGTVNVLNAIDTRGGTGGGTVDVESTVGDTVIRRIYARTSSGSGSTVTIDAAGNGDIGEILAAGDTGGEVRIGAGGALVLGTSPGSDFDASGASGGVVEAQAAGDLTTTGRFRAAAGGCIGLSAGGTLDTAGASFDVPLSASCP
jgi:hypothetical protein